MYGGPSFIHLAPEVSSAHPAARSCSSNRSLLADGFIFGWPFFFSLPLLPPQLNYVPIIVIVVCIGDEGCAYIHNTRLDSDPTL